MKFPFPILHLVGTPTGASAVGSVPTGHFSIVRNSKNIFYAASKIADAAVNKFRNIVVTRRKKYSS
jgi:hypothetical protein